MADLSTLTPRELDVLAAIAEGWTNPAIAARLFVSERTVEAHAQSIFTKLDVGQRGTNKRVAAVLAYLTCVAGLAA